MSKTYYCVEYRGTLERPGACYGSSLHLAEAEAAQQRAAARGLQLVIVPRPARPDVAGWLTPCDDPRPGFGKRRARRKSAR